MSSLARLVRSLRRSLLRPPQPRRPFRKPRLEELERRDVPSAAPSLPLLFDFGNYVSPVQAGYVGVPLTLYSPELGYGWNSVKEVRGADQGGGVSDLIRDFHFASNEATFMVDLPDGTYEITAVMGVRWKNFDQVDLYAEGERVASNLTTTAGGLLKPTFTAEVNDGRLDLRIVDTGGEKKYWVINGLEIRPAVRVSVEAVTVQEGDTEAVFNVRLSSASQQPVTVRYATADGSATTRDNDYRAAAGLLTFAPGETLKTVRVGINADTRAEGDEEFTLRLSDPTNATLDNDSALGVIHDPSDLSQTVIINDAWLSSRGEGSYVLNEANKTYVLHNDLRVDGTAFVVGASGVTLDLNGHTVTYGDADPLTVVNGGFEEGEGGDVPGWDLSGAPSAGLAANTRYLFGEQVLRLSNFNTAQRLLSDAIAIPEAGRMYTATVTPANPQTRSSVRLSVVDAVTGQVLASDLSDGPGRGTSAVVSFLPTTTNAVRLQIDVTPPAGVTDSIDLDAVTLTPTGHYGVMASRSWGGDIPGFSNLTTEAQTLYRQAADFTVTNGSLVQGRADAYASSPLFFRSLPGFTIDNVETYATGMDTLTLEATYASVRARIINSTFREAIPNISNRFHLYATLKLNNVAAPIEIEGNRIIGSPQVGIMMAMNDARFTVSIRDNEFRGNSVVTNGYAILLSAVQNFVVADNTITPDSGKGINLDGYNSNLLGHGELTGNHVDVKERANREYPTGLESVALRLRNTVDAMGTHLDLDIHDNTFIARSGPGFVENAYGVRISYVNKNGAMDDAGIRLVDNTIKAITSSADPWYHARALVFDKVEAGINLRIAGNVLESNDTSLAFGDSGGGASDIDLVSNTLRKSGEGAARAYTGILAGYYTREVRDVRLIDLRLEGGATADIAWAGTGYKEVIFATLLDVTVKDGAGQPVAGAAVQVTDDDGNVVFEGTTAADGTVKDVVVPTHVFRQTTSDRRNITTESFGPHRVLASLNGVTAEEVLTLTDEHEELELTLAL